MEPKIKNNFKLSKSNMIYYLTVIIILTVLFFLLSEKTAYGFGALSGQLFSLLIIPSIFAWIAWRVAGKKTTVGSVVFNIVLTIFVFGQISGFVSNSLENKQLNDMLNESKTFKKKFDKIKDPAVAQKEYKKYVGSVSNKFDNMAKTSSGENKIVYSVLGELSKQSNYVLKDWFNSVNETADTRILDFSILKRKGEFEYQTKIIKKYIHCTKIYKKHFNNAIKLVQTKLNEREVNELTIIGVINGMKKKMEPQKKAFNSLIDLHIKQGNNLLSTIEMLKNNINEWSYEDEKLLIKTDNILNKYNLLADKLVKYDAEIQKLSANYKW